LDILEATPANIPYTGALTIGSWNAQALYSVDMTRHHTKWTEAMRLMGQNQILILQETHSTPASTLLDPQDGILRWHSHCTQRQAGLSIWIRRSWLQALRPTRAPRWVEIEEGRVGLLDIASMSGRLCILGVYLQTGDAALLRRQALDKAMKHVPHPSTAATWLLGDFNFVMQADDRMWYAGADTTGGWNEGESAAWHRLASDHSFRELFQPHYTHRTSSGCSRLDRAYCNLHLASKQDTTEFCTVDKWVSHCSAHRAIRAGTRRCGPIRPLQMQPSVLADERWSHYVRSRHGTVLFAHGDPLNA
jgi:hypothetical protein